MPSAFGARFMHGRAPATLLHMQPVTLMDTPKRQPARAAQDGMLRTFAAAVMRHRRALRCTRCALPLVLLVLLAPRRWMI